MASMEGTVSRCDGSSVFKRQRLYLYYEGVMQHYVKTDTSGDYFLSGLAVGVEFDVFINLETTGTPDLTKCEAIDHTIKVTSEGHYEGVDFTRKCTRGSVVCADVPSNSVDGLIVDERGMPAMEPLMIQLRPIGGGDPLVGVETNPMGAFLITAPPGEYEVVIDGMLASPTITITEGWVEEDFTVAPPASG